MLITFSGLDGAGKSTLVAWLKTMLEERNRPVVVRHMNYDVGVYAFAQLLRDRLLGRNGARRGTGAPPSARRPTLYRRIRHAIVWNKLLRRLIYPLDLLVFLGYRIYFEKARKQILVMDRYFYDTLVDVADGRRWTWLRFLHRLTPTPDLAVFVASGPEDSHRRKGEYSVEYLRHRWAAYLKILPWAPTAVTLPNRDLNDAKAALEGLVAARLEAR